MDAYLGIDLGSTTSKAVLIDRQRAIIGRGLTNTRSNYDVAVEVAKREALIDARLGLLRTEVGALLDETAADALRRALVVAVSLHRLANLRDHCVTLLAQIAPAQTAAVTALFQKLTDQADAIFAPLADDRSRFFRDAVSTRFLAEADDAAHRLALDFASVVGTYDRAIVETEASDQLPPFAHLVDRALERVPLDEEARTAVQEAAGRSDQQAIRIIGMVGTGYGRQRLPFAKEQIQSEILCHGLGAHALFPRTRTVLDIGGQDTKAIQLDESGWVSSFQMNDRCAAGCGRYLGYVADEMNIGIDELGPLALRGSRAVKISSTCTVFAGVELRELLAAGERRENILLGLHQAIVLRAMSLIARSGGVKEEFTFTGGVAKNDAIVRCVREALAKHYGIERINISHDSIFMGALGAALFAERGGVDGGAKERAS